MRPKRDRLVQCSRLRLLRTQHCSQQRCVLDRERSDVGGSAGRDVGGQNNRCGCFRHLAEQRRHGDGCQPDPGEMAKRLKADPQLSLVMLPNVVAAQGALPIKIGDDVIGAAGASGAPGGEKDEACVKAALDKVADKLK